MTAEYMTGKGEPEYVPTSSGSTVIPCRIRIDDVTYPGLVVVIPPSYIRTFILKEDGRWASVVIRSDDWELIWVGEK